MPVQRIRLPSAGALIWFLAPAKNYAMTSHTRRIPSIWLAAIPLVATLAAAMLGWALGGAQTLDVGTPADGPYVAEFFDRESAAGESYRWSKTDAWVRLPAVRAPWMLTLRMAGRPGGVDVALRVDGRALPSFSVKPLEIRRYRVLVGPGVHPSELTEVVFGAQAERTPADGRRLAVLVESVIAQPNSAVPDIPPLPTALALGALALAGWALLALSGAGLGAATVVSTVLGIGLAAAWTVARLEVGPYLPGAAVAAVAGAGLLGGLRVGWRGSLDGPQLAGLVAAAAGVAPLALLLSGQADPGLPPLLQALLVPLGLGALLARGDAGRALGALALLAGLAAAALLLSGSLTEADVGTPFHALHRAGARLWFGTLPLYNVAGLDANPFAPTFSGPPALAALALPFATTPYPQAIVAWRAAAIAALLASWIVLVRAYGARPAAALGLLLLAVAPTFAALAEGQAAPLLLLLLALGLYALRRGRDDLLGACVGAAAALSPPALLLLGFALAQRRWRALGFAAASFALLALGGLLVAGWPAHAIYLGDVAPALAQSTAWPLNQSLHAFTARLLEPDQLGLRPLGTPQAQRAGWLAALALLALTAWLSRRRDQAELGYALWLAALLLAAPVAWAPELILLALPLLVLVAAADGRVAWPSVACAALGVALLALADPLALSDEVLRGRFWGLALSAGTAAALLVYAAVALASLPTHDERPTTNVAGSS